MQRLISLKPISVSFVSPQKQKRIRAHRFSDFLHHHEQSFSSPSSGDVLSAEDDEMLITVSDELRQWLHNKNLQGFIKVAEVEPHPQAKTLMQEIDVTKITTKKVRNALQMQRGGFDVVKRVSEEAL